MWWEGNTCNMHLDKLAAHVKDGVQAAGLVGLRFNTIGCERRHLDGDRGHELLPAFARPDRGFHRDRRRRQWYDAVVTIPGLRQEHARLGDGDAAAESSVHDGYGGTIKPGFAQGKPRDVISAFQSYGEYSPGVITDEQRLDIVTHACPGRRRVRRDVHREHDGDRHRSARLSLPYSSSTPAEDPGKKDECRRAGARFASCSKRT
jgi:dihydroxy-acid dehydratase